MRGGDNEFFPNPFAPEPQRTPTNARRAFVSSLKSMIVVVAGFLVLSAILAFGRSSIDQQNEPIPTPTSEPIANDLHDPSAPIVTNTALPEPTNNIEPADYLEPADEPSGYAVEIPSMKSRIVQAGFTEFEQVDWDYSTLDYGDNKIQHDVKTESLPNQDSGGQRTPLTTIEVVETAHFESDDTSRRQMTQEELIIANTIALGTAQHRLDVIEHLALQPATKAKPWLSLLLDDSSREVKLRSIELLTQLHDPSLLELLRCRLPHETDQTVAFRMRQALKLR